MQSFSRLAALSLLPLLSLTCQAGAMDREWEQQIAERLLEQAEVSETVWLQAGGEEFLGLFNRQSSDNASGAVIILHGMGAHADWPRLISPLRLNLPGQGWSTLSIQLPLVAIEHPIEDYGKTLSAAKDRLEAAVRFLQTRKYLNIVVIGHSFGAATVLSYLSDSQRPRILALAAIGLQEYPFLKPAINVLDLIEAARLPILDIYGGRDYLRVRNHAPDRRLAAKKAGNKNYKQVEVPGANHYFYKMEDVLAKQIRGWLDKTAPGVPIMVNQEFDGNDEDQEKQQQ